MQYLLSDEFSYKLSKFSSIHIWQYAAAKVVDLQQFYLPTPLLLSCCQKTKVSKNVDFASNSRLNLQQQN
jgi:hypothetical protein